MTVWPAGRRTVFLTILVLLVLVSDASAQKPAPPGPGPADCGQDFDCFLRRAQTCAPARLVRTDDFDFFGLQGRSTTQYELAGPQGGGCRYSQRALSLRVRFGPLWRQKLREEGYTDDRIADL